MGLRVRLLMILLISENIASVLCTFSWGPCPSLPGNQEALFFPSIEPSFTYATGQLNPVEYLGDWYDTLRNKDFKYAKGNCTQAFYYIQNGKVGVQNSEIVDGKNSSITGEVFLDSDIQGQLYAKFFRFAPLGDYKVIHTDYKNTALVFSCVSVWVAHWKWAWVLVRNRRTKVEFYNKAIESLGIPLDGMVRTNQDVCNYAE